MSKFEVEVLDEGIRIKEEGECFMATNVFYGCVSYEALQNLEGKVLTLIDASISDKEQRKAMKDLFRNIYWFQWISNSMWRGKNPFPVGMPTEQEVNK
jgi:hypothetical protein